MDKYLSVKQASEWLGFHENTIRKWIKKGILRGYRLPGTRTEIRIKVKELEALMQSGSDLAK